MRRLRPLLPALLVASLAVVAGLPTLGYDFVYDDHAVILERQPFWEDGLVRFLTTRHWGTGRHLTLISLDLDRLWLGGAPAAFHATNVALSALVSVLVLYLGVRLGLGMLAATAAACVFAVHPTHADAVASLVGRAELLAAAGVLAVMLAALPHRPPLRTFDLRIFAISLAGAFAAFHSKENALCLPALLFLAWLTHPARVALLPAMAGTAVAAAAWALHVLPLAREVVTAQFVDNPLAYDPFLMRAAKALAVLLEYARLTVFPYPLLPDRSYAQTDPSVAAGIVAAAAWTGAAIMLLRLRPRIPRAVFATGWFAVAFAVTGNVAFATGTIMAERLLFLPSVGACLGFGLAAHFLATRVPRGATIAAAATAATVAVFLVLFQARASVWASDAEYFAASAAASPRSAKAQYDLGMYLARAGRSDESQAAFERALAIHPAFSRANFYLAERKAAGGRIDEAIALYERYLREVPDDAGALTNLTRLLLEAGRPHEALERARSLVAIQPESAAARDTLVVAESAARRAEGRRINP